MIVLYAVGALSYPSGHVTDIHGASSYDLECDRRRRSGVRKARRLIHFRGYSYVRLRRSYARRYGHE